jgi:hypothetical protein
LAAADSDGKNTYALLVGVSDYAEGKPPEAAEFRGVSDLSSSSTDASNMAAILLRSGVPAKNIRELHDSAATADAIRSGLDWLDAMAGQAATLVFYFSGHGSGDVPDLDGDESSRHPADRQDEALLPYDALDLTARAPAEIAASPALRARFLRQVITDDELYRHASAWHCSVIIIVDSCFSGGVFMGGPATDGARPAELLGKSAHILRPVDQVLFLREAQAPSGAAGQSSQLELPENVVFLAASQEDQDAIDDRTLQSGWFTYGLKTALTDPQAMRKADRNQDREVSLAEAYDYSVLTISILKAERGKLSPLLRLVGGVPMQQPLALNLRLAEQIVFASY